MERFHYVNHAQFCENRNRIFLCYIGQHIITTLAWESVHQGVCLAGMYFPATYLLVIGLRWSFASCLVWRSHAMIFTIGIDGPRVYWSFPGIAYLACHDVMTTVTLRTETV